jgi:hypothetical protein
MVLVSQIQRSGGTLLSRLFDGHPECHAHPYELKIGHKARWPKLELDAPESWFAALYEQKVAQHLVSGWSKPGLKETEVDVFPFLFLPRLQKRLFDACIAEGAVERQRDVLDAYFTAYFNAWVDNQNLYSGPKRLVTAFTPRTNLDPKSVKRFFRDYPDGWLVTIVREPRAWYASASRFAQRPRRRARALARVRDGGDRAQGYGDRVVIVTYDELAQEPGDDAGAGRALHQLGPVLLVRPSTAGPCARTRATLSPSTACSGTARRRGARFSSPRRSLGWRSSQVTGTSRHAARLGPWPRQH